MIPTRDVPEGLTADEYFRLSIQYLLLGWKRQMVAAARRAAQMKVDLHSKLPYGLNTEDYEKIGIALGVVESAMDIAGTASDAFRETWELLRDAATAADLALDDIEPLSQIKREIQSGFGVLSKEFGSFFNKAFEDLVLPAFGVPGRDIPENLTAQEYLDIGKKYKSLGWCEQARDALLKAEEVATDNETAREAKRFRITRIPKQPVPHHAVQKNIEGFNQLTRGDVQRARITFEALARDYPEFEWPKGNLGSVYSQLGDLDKAETVLSEVVDYNSNYLNGWLHFARLKAAKLELPEAQRYLDKALRLDPEDEPAKALKQIIDFLSL
jgi:tetratricopeptide (TPR) repeat protein